MSDSDQPRIGETRGDYVARLLGIKREPEVILMINRETNEITIGHASDVTKHLRTFTVTPRSWPSGRWVGRGNHNDDAI